MKILRNVAVKQILTEKSRQKLLEIYVQQQQQLEKECGQLQFELKKLEKAKKVSGPVVHVQFEKEIKSRQEKSKHLEFQIAQLEMLPLGSELKEKEVQAIIELKPGEAWEDGIHQHEIIIKDGIIKEIR